MNNRKGSSGNRLRNERRGLCRGLWLAAASALFFTWPGMGLGAGEVQEGVDDENGSTRVAEDGRTAEELIAIEFYGFRALIENTDEKGIAELTRETLAAMDRPERPPTTFVDGVMWGRRGDDGTLAYAGQSYDAASNSRSAGFEFFHRENRDQPVIFPLGTFVFGRCDAFAWRGDAMRNVFILPADAEPDWAMDVSVFDILFGCSVQPEETFKSHVATPGLHVRTSELQLEQGERVLVLRAEDDEGLWHARLTSRYHRAADRLPHQWTVELRSGRGDMVVWRYNLRQGSAVERRLPSTPAELTDTYSDVRGMHDPPLVDRSGTTIRSLDDLNSVYAAQAESQRRLISVALSVLFFYILLLTNSAPV